MMSIKENLEKIKTILPPSVTLVAVSKTKPIADLMQAYNAGQRVFGENKIQEMTQKWQSMPKDVEWHMIGHVQRNKVKYMAEYVALIHGVDSLKLLREIDKQANKYNRVIDCLLQMHIAEEETKFGFDETELLEMINATEFELLKNVKVVGLMGMATFTTDKTKIRREFKKLKTIFDTLRAKMPDLHVLSMGMSGDYDIALEEGSTMIRIGSSIFGERNMQ